MSNCSRFRPAAVTLLLRSAESVFSPQVDGIRLFKDVKAHHAAVKGGFAGCTALTRGLVRHEEADPPWVICLVRDVVREKAKFFSEISRFSCP